MGIKRGVNMLHDEGISSFQNTKEDAPKGMSEVTVHFKDAAGGVTTVKGIAGQTLLDVAHQYDVDLEGACGGALSCSTCHVIVDKAFFDKLPQASDDEEDMLDLATGLTNTSRLGCQVILTPDLEGLTVSLPGQTRHMVTVGR
jgi:ferredoxin